MTDASSAELSPQPPQPRPRRRQRLTWAAIAAATAVTAVIAAAAIPRVVSLTYSPRVISAGESPDALALAPEGRTLYVGDVYDPANTTGWGHLVTPVNLATGQVERPVDVGGTPSQLAVPGAGRILYAIVDDGNGISRFTQTVLGDVTPGTPIPGLFSPVYMVASPDDRTLYVTVETVPWDPSQQEAPAENTEVVPVGAATGEPGKPIPGSLGTIAEAISPDGKTLYAIDGNGPDSGQTPSRAVVAIDLATGRAGLPVTLPDYPDSLAVTADGRTLMVASGTYPGGTYDNGPPTGRTLTAIDTATGTVTARVILGCCQPESGWYAPAGYLALAPDGKTAYLLDHSHTVTQVNLGTGRTGDPLVTTPGYTDVWNVGLLLTPDGHTLYVAQEHGVSVIPL